MIAGEGTMVQQLVADVDDAQNGGSIDGVALRRPVLWHATAPKHCELKQAKLNAIVGLLLPPPTTATQPVQQPLTDFVANGARRMHMTAMPHTIITVDELCWPALTLRDPAAAPPVVPVAPCARRPARITGHACGRGCSCQ